MIETAIKNFSDALDAWAEFGRESDGEAVYFDDARYIRAANKVRKTLDALLAARFPGLRFSVCESVSSFYAQIETAGGDVLTIRASDHSNTSNLHASPTINLVSGDSEISIEVDLDSFAEELGAAGIVAA